MRCYYNFITCCDYYCIIYYYNLIIYDIYIYYNILTIVEMTIFYFFFYINIVFYLVVSFYKSIGHKLPTTKIDKSIQGINAGLYHLSHFTRNIPHDTFFQGDCFPHAGNCEEGSGKQGLLVQGYMYLHVVLSLSLSI